MPSMLKVKSFLQAKLLTDKKWALHALVKIYDLQTESEQGKRSSIFANNVGFSKLDALKLSEYAEKTKKGFNLSSSELQHVFNLLPKYWGQVFVLSDIEKLKKIIEESNFQVIAQTNLFSKKDKVIDCVYGEVL